MKQVIRIEKNGIGIFRSTCSFSETQTYDDIVDFHTNYFNNPWIDRLDIYKDDKEWFCAYKSIEQFQHWINKYEFNEAISYGFKVYLYEVTEYQEGAHQIIFTQEGVTKKENITQLLQASWG